MDVMDVMDVIMLSVFALTTRTHINSLSNGSKEGD